MLKTAEAVIEKDGHVRIILDDEKESSEPALLSEDVLAKDWRRDEEEAAWRHLQQEP